MLLWNGWKVGIGPFSGSFNFPSKVLERLKPEFLVSALMALMAPDFTSCFACSVAVAVSTTGCSDSERLTPPWLAVLLLLCFFRASNAFFFFFSLLNFFCRASSSSLSPGGITNMVAPGSGAGPKTSFCTVAVRGLRAAAPSPAPGAGGLCPSPYPLLKLRCPASPAPGSTSIPSPPAPRGPGGTPSVAKTTAPEPPSLTGVSMATAGFELQRRQWSPRSALRATE